MSLHEIQIWNVFGPTIVEINSLAGGFSWRIEPEVRALPEELEKRISKNWQEAGKTKKLVDNPTTYLVAPVECDNENISIRSNIRGFRYTQAFNRNPTFQDMTRELREYKLLTISTHCHLLTRDDRLLFGTKKNQFNQVSGFGGFPNAREEISLDDEGGGGYVDTHKVLTRSLRKEIGDELGGALEEIAAVGVVFVNTPGLRGIDSDYLARIGVLASDAKKKFEESSQFTRGLHSVEFSPRELSRFIIEMNAGERKMSRYALGCLYAETKAFLGTKEAGIVLGAIKEHAGTTISTENETDYFG